ncbi:MAG: hypothetical protein J0L84_17220 [Verrucomicrobia bacterium]|nr:hypothetical protein [Verrucomicrobiota bacterium]
MKSAYELAMERLGAQAPGRTLSAEQKHQIAELESVAAATIAQKDLALQAEVARSQAAGDEDAVAHLRQRFRAEKQSVEQDLEAAKDRVRSGEPGSRSRGSTAR